MDEKIRKPNSALSQPASCAALGSVIADRYEGGLPEGAGGACSAHTQPQGPSTGLGIQQVLQQYLLKE